MSAPQDDWLDALRDAWRQSPAPAPHRALADEDGATQAAVRWVREAWLALPVPALRLPTRAVPAETPVIASSRWRQIAVAAALLVAVGVPLLVFAARRAIEERLQPLAPVAEAPRAEPLPPPLVAPAPPGPPAVPAVPAVPADESMRPEPAAHVAAVDEHHLELRSGPVRLYLITDSPPSHDEVPR